MMMHKTTQDSMARYMAHVAHGHVASGLRGCGPDFSKYAPWTIDRAASWASEEEDEDASVYLGEVAYLQGRGIQ